MGITEIKRKWFLGIDLLMSKHFCYCPVLKC